MFYKKKIKDSYKILRKTFNYIFIILQNLLLFFRSFRCLTLEVPHFINLLNL